MWRTSNRFFVAKVNLRQCVVCRVEQEVEGEISWRTDGGDLQPVYIYGSELMDFVDVDSWTDEGPIQRNEAMLKWSLSTLRTHLSEASDLISEMNCSQWCCIVFFQQPIREEKQAGSSSPKKKKKNSASFLNSSLLQTSTNVSKQCCVCSVSLADTRCSQ